MAAKNEIERRSAAKAFSEFWKDKGYEKGESQKFWLALLSQVYGIEKPDQFIEFEDQVHLDHTSFIDGYIPETKVLIEQKSLGKDLRKPIRQSDGTSLTPFQQAKRYAAELPYSQRPRWIITCNFAEFLVYDMENPNAEPEEILLKNLGKEYYRLNFLTDVKSEVLAREMEVSIKAGDLVGKLYDALRKQYVDPEEPEALRSLNILCVRFVFCLYAEDADVFNHLAFHDYIKDFKPHHLRNAVIDLFKVLNTPLAERSPYMDEELKAFPYVNGGLFREEDIIIPQFTEEIQRILVEDASANFDWSEISPTIFGAVFESTLNPETRRKGGMHYTSIENIHKVIDPLFLNDLRDELENIKLLKRDKDRINRADQFTDKLSKLKFLDPACGSGNFLTETYISIRTLENEALKIKYKDQMIFDLGDIIKVNIDQFYGIEINDFAVTVAKTALWIAEHQMMVKTAEIVHRNLEFLPLTTNAYIAEGNALQVDWNEIVPKNELNYIMGNPPFVGYAYQSAEQKQELSHAVNGVAKNIDYVVGWYYLAAKMMQGNSIRTAFVSTNSITQGEQVTSAWKHLYTDFNIHIDFAHRTFRWDSEASLKAHVHCVIIGFSIAPNKNEKVIFSSDRLYYAEEINPYLLDAKPVFIERRTKPLCDVPEMVRGSQPTDDGNLILTEEEKEELIKLEPLASQFIRPFMMGKDFINRRPRYCIWLVGANPTELKKCHKIMERVSKVREFRLLSKKAATRTKADTPTLFDEIRDSKTDYVALPKVSSEARRYVPIDYLSKNVIAGDKLFMIADSTLFNFGILTSNVHMAWMRVVAGRLKSDYSYSNTIVYNNFPWPNPTAEQKAKIEQTAQAILDARAKYPDSSLADLYDELTMPPELRRAHQQNDKAVMAAYGWKSGDAAYSSESACVAELMKLYSDLTK